MKPGGMESWILGKFIPNLMIAKSLVYDRFSIVTSLG